MKKYSHDEALTTSATALLDHARGSLYEKNVQTYSIQGSGTLDRYEKELAGEKSLTIRWKSRGDEFDWIQFGPVRPIPPPSPDCIRCAETAH